MRGHYQKLWITRLKSEIFLHLFFLILIFITFYLRIYHAPLGWFFHDSARDILMAQAIATGKLYPSVGPSAGGIFPLGPFYYYLLSAPFSLAKREKMGLSSTSLYLFPSYSSPCHRHLFWPHYTV